MRSEVFRSLLPRDPSCGSAARRLIEAHLGQRLNGALDDAKTIASELVNNAYLHGEGRIELRVAAEDDRLQIDVIDEGHSSDLAVTRLYRPESRGLGIVDRLSHQWGCREGKTHVWAELLI